MNLGVTSLAATERRIVEDGEIFLDGASRRFQLKPKPTIVSPRSATQRPSGSSARQHFGNATDGGAGDGRAPWRTRNVARILRDALGLLQIFELRKPIGDV